MTVELETPPAARLSEAELREWIQTHRVCWETITHRERAWAEIRPVGYDILLSARVDRGSCDPGGDQAVEAVAHLKQFAEAVIPTDSGEDVTLGPLEPTLQLRPQSEWQPEARLQIEIRHDEDYFGAIDDEERTCLRRIEAALSAWGARRDAWSARVPSGHS